MKILLTYPPSSLTEGWNPLRFPLGIVCLASFLKEKGFDVTIYYDQPYTPHDIVTILKEDKPEVVGFSCDSTNFNSCFELSKIVKGINKDIYVILGGIHATFFHKQILEKVPTIDIVVRYEGEETLWEILEHIKDNKEKKDLSKIKGISYKINNKILTNTDRPFISNLDTLPFLSYDLIDMSKIELSYNFPGWWPIHTGRGCCYNCKFCASVGQWKRVYRAKSAERVVKEVELCYDKYNILGCFFYDLTFTINKKRVHEICNYLKERKIKIKWGCRTRIDCVNRDLLRNMHESGCERIVYGVESFSDRMLKLMGKPYKASQAIEALNYTKDTGIESRFQIMLGFPGETEETLQETLGYMKYLDKGVICNSVNIYQLHPGSEMYNIAKKLELVGDEAWFLGFKMEDFIHRYYPASFIKKIYETERAIKELFNTPTLPL